MSLLFVVVCVFVCLCVRDHVNAYVSVLCVLCSQQPSQHHPLSAPGFSPEDLQEAQFSQELQPLTVCRLHLTEHTLRT